MQSLTKNKQSEFTIRKMTEKFFCPLKLKSYQELTEGYFNVAYEIILSNDESVILKVAPLADTRIMTYERNIMRAEVEAMQLADKHGNIPVPKVLGYDDSCTICESPYFFMEKIKGESLNAIKDSLTTEQLMNIYIESGKINKIINTITCPCFGYPAQPEFQGSDWFTVFTKMMKAGIKDAKLANIDLKIDVSKLLDCLKKDKNIFAEVVTPHLVHWDCWDGNIFVHNGKITGIIDWERSLWADPLMEVGFRTYGDNDYFQKGYGLKRLTDNQKRRALWYDVYLMILVSLECEYRKYETQDTYNWSTNILTSQLRKLLF